MVRSACLLDPGKESDPWLEAFHAGERATLEACYREYFPLVEREAAKFLGACDGENVVHEVFYRLLASVAARQSFQGGSFAAWIRIVTRNQALDYLRRHRPERSADSEPAAETGEPCDFEERAQARLLVEQFRTRILPEKWQGVFDARFLRQLDQRRAAAELGLSRTTLAYQEHKIRGLLKRFLRQTEES